MPPAHHSRPDLVAAGAAGAAGAGEPAAADDVLLLMGFSAGSARE
jgi:hypothetical protein